MSVQRPLAATTRLVGVIGWPVAHSRSPAIHNAAFEALGLDWRYVPLPVRPDQVGAAVAGLGALGFVGVNVTVPHKQTVIPYLHHVSPDVGVLGAVNTIVVREDEAGRPLLYGFNTDHTGFVEALREGGFDPQGCRALVLGAGGAARAVVYGLIQAGAASVTVLNRSPGRAESLAADLAAARPGVALTTGPLVPDEMARASVTVDLLVNTTSVGMWPAIDESPWPDEATLPAHLTVYDVVYHPEQTRLLRQAAAAGARPIGGLGMLIHQAARAFELWTSQKPPLDIMRAAVRHNG